ncbi:cell growth regulator with EF hand domain protein 1 [Tiliqua scincoides]|uniref:cell growth regulator with EF hand domain protein 1 n=1 Tax=Tiliqua scincoides TaxID=71010 RepID=UPI003462E444
MKEVLLTTLLLSVSTSWAAPKDGTSRPEAPNDSRHQSVLNPLHPGKESLWLTCGLVCLRALQDYLKNAGQVDRDAGAMTREQALLLLFALHDYDKSGRLDGLEFMWLLNELASEQADGQPGPDLVVLTVDGILEAQDLNRDGLLEPSELLLAAHQDQAPGFFATPNGEHGIVQWALDGKADGPPGPPDQESTAEATAALETFQEEQGKTEAPSLNPPEWGFDHEAPVNTQGQAAEMSPGQGD